MVQINTNISELKGKVDFGIITIREDEFEAIQQRLPIEQIAVGRQRYAISRLKTISDDEYVIAHVRCLEPGIGVGQSVARTLIEELNPQWILLVGIAGSLPDYEHTLGDVILAARLHDFSVSAIIENDKQEVRQEFAGGGGPMHPDVQNLVASLPMLTPYIEKWYTPDSLTVSRPEVKFGRNSFYGDDGWKRKVRESLDRYFGKKSIRQQPKALAASVASSGVLLKDTQTASLWLSTARQIKGVEMELSGVYQAGWDLQKPVLAIRGISDIVGFKRSPDWTGYACHTAAAFTVALLRSRPIMPLMSQKSSEHDTEADSSTTLQNQQVGVFKQKPPNPAPLAKQEQLFSNLLEVSYFPETLYSVETCCEDDRDVWAILNNEMFNPPNDWIIRAKTLYAFHDFSDPIWKKVIEDNTTEPQSTSHWAASDNNDRMWEFIDLLKNCLKEFGKGRDLKYIHTQRIQGETKPFKYIYFAATTEFAKSPLFQDGDFKDINQFVSILKEGSDPLAKHIFEQFSPETQELIEQHPDITDAELRRHLVEGLNRILKNSLYDPRLFEEVRVRWEAQRLLEKDFLKEKELTTLNRMLLEDAYRSMIVKRYLATRKVVEKSVTRSSPTEVFKGVFSKTGFFYYYRHHAFRPHFMRIDGKWYLEITPTYHYTWNGHRVSFNYEEQTSGIKRLEGSEAVFRQVVLWARTLQGDKIEFLGQEVYPYLRFGDLLEFPFDYGVPDKAWLNKEISGGEEEHEPKKGRRRGRGSRKPTNPKPSQTLFA
jgi:nucleoside phosphorylase